MNSWIVRLLVLKIGAFSFISVSAQTASEPLYTGTVPNAKTIPADSLVEFLDTSRGYYGNVRIPGISVYPCSSEKRTGTAVVVFPGGGYRVVVDEGAAFAKAFNDEGITVFVLKYRLPNQQAMYNSSICPLQDAQMAIRYARQHAGQYGIDASKIGVLGISAGGHLATTLTNHADSVLINNPEKINLRPDFMILLYPVISFLQYPVKTTVERLLGANADSSSLAYFSNERYATRQTPPTFLLHAADDEQVSVRHSLIYYEALLQAAVPAELHVLQSGGHAFGLEHSTRGNEWWQYCMAWMRENGFAKTVSR
ncbi:MAG: alpha/beta hydrolase [Bacteroidota bacterium]|nr:alpha/beta hydrolase [Bacteroidota bacterium]